MAQWNTWFKGNARLAAKVITDLSTRRERPVGIWCLQEITTDSSYSPGFNLPDFLVQELGFSGVFHVTREVKGDPHYKMGLAIYSRWPVALDQIDILQREDFTTHPDRMQENRAALVTKVATPLGKLTAVTAQLSWPDEQLATEVPRYCRTLRRYPSGLIACSDLNIQPDNAHIPALRDAARFVGPVAKTWPTKDVVCLDGVFKPAFLAQYDYVQTSNDLEAVRAEVVDTPEVRDASDHLIVLTDIVRRAPGSTAPLLSSI